VRIFTFLSREADAITSNFMKRSGASFVKFRFAPLWGSITGVTLDCRASMALVRSPAAIASG
jgi:hypothetical protein